MLEAMCSGGGAWWAWAGFFALVLLLLLLDIKVFHKRTHAVGIREALLWTLFWVALSLVFNAFVWYECGATRGLEFFTGYLLEKSLSFDNLFVILLVFTAFSIPTRLQHRVLFWGILGALVLRGIFIVAGTALVARFVWVFYLFGAFLVWTGIRMFLDDGKEEFDHDRNIAVRIVRRFFPVSKKLDGERLFTKVNGRRAVTVLFVALCVVEFSDVIFAFDSIPAIFAITTNPFIVFTSNVFAILGLRSLYFVIARAHDLFVHLKTGLALILVFIGVKLLFKHWYEIPIVLSLEVVATILAVSVLYSIVERRRDASKLRQR
jgi:tellurite resistance protein TerC